ncbi:MAG TPA: FecR domain-containing protein [Polyangiaceae bacterium]|nr:FecR domain-containing protein [Polyangiaceae bacterium]
MSDKLDKLVADARRELGVREAKDVDWNKVDAELFERIAREERGARAHFAPPARRGATLVAVGFAAAAALAAVVVGKGRDAVDLAGTAAPEGAATIAAVDANGSDSLLVDGQPAARGASLRLGDVLETRSARATLDRPGKLTAVLEPGSRMVVTHVRGALVLELDQGAVEAQVVPVASGEAFAVDVDGARVAVHGTHLRVAREGGRVVVDLSEGVVAVGQAPREGSVIGTVINAPAHVEFLARDPLGTLTQTHDPSAVRRPLETRVAAADRPRVAPAHAEATARPSPPSEPRVEPRSSWSGAAGAPPPASNATASAKPVTAKPEGSPEESLAQAVRACMSTRPHADNVTVVVSTTLHLDLADDGSVRAARFEPPVAPDVNTCAAQAIYRARFAHGGAATITVDFTN